MADDEDEENLMGPSIDLEVKDGQWMGVTVRSQGVGGKVCYYFLEYEI